MYASWKLLDIKRLLSTARVHVVILQETKKEMIDGRDAPLSGLLGRKVGFLPANGMSGM